MADKKQTADHMNSKPGVGTNFNVNKNVQHMQKTPKGFDQGMGQKSKTTKND